MHFQATAKPFTCMSMRASVCECACVCVAAVWQCGHGYVCRTRTVRIAHTRLAHAFLLCASLSCPACPPPAPPPAATFACKFDAKICEIFDFKRRRCRSCCRVLCCFCCCCVFVLSWCLRCRCYCCCCCCSCNWSGLQKFMAFACLNLSACFTCKCSQVPTRNADKKEGNILQSASGQRQRQWRDGVAAWQRCNNSGAATEHGN